MIMEQILGHILGVVFLVGEMYSRQRSSYVNSINQSPQSNQSNLPEPLPYTR
jgi:hypothetical protein